MGAHEIKALREQTGAGILNCKAALEASNGDLIQATDFLRKKGLASATKKSGRATQEGSIGSYIHAGGKIGVLIEVSCETDFVARNPEFKGLLRDLAMQIAGSSPAPRYVRKEEVPKELLDKERVIYEAQARESKKPEAVIEKIANGKINKFIQEICLLEQAFIKDPKIKIKEVISAKIAKMGENIQVRRFTRYQLGEAAD